MEKLAKLFEAISKLIELDSCSPLLKATFTGIALSTETNPLSQDGKLNFRESVFDLISILK